MLVPRYQAPPQKANSIRKVRVQLIWDEFLKIIKEEAGSQVVETWFKAVTLLEWDAASRQVILKAPNPFVKDWVQQHYTQLLKTHLGRLLHTDDLKLFILCNNQPLEDKNNKKIIPASMASDDQLFILEPQKSAPVIRSHHPTVVKQPARPSSYALITQDKKEKAKVSNNLNPSYLFHNFVVGPSNSLAHAAAFAIVNNLGKVYNPLFIYGGTGLGKTHLMHAIGNEVKNRNPKIVIRYETSDRFINEFITSIRLDRSMQFREKYQKVDLLLLDDIQFLSNKEQTQEMFFHIFNVLYEEQKQIILSSDTFPQEITGLQGRLKSRMEWGLVADVQFPDLETKIAILCKKAEQHNIKLNDDVADYIASRVRSNIRELEGALIRVGAFSALINQPVTLELAKKVLLNLVEETKKEGVILSKVLKIVAKDYDVSINDIKSKKRYKDIATARAVTFFLMKKLSYCSLQAIGGFIGGRDHSTVIHAINKIEDQMTHDDAFKKKVHSIEQKILTD